MRNLEQAFRKQGFYTEVADNKFSITSADFQLTVLCYIQKEKTLHFISAYIKYNGYTTITPASGTGQLLLQECTCRQQSHQYGSVGTLSLHTADMSSLLELGVRLWGICGSHTGNKH
jgi:hypothetical protein